MKDRNTLDFPQVKELIKEYEAVSILADKYQVFNSKDIQKAFDAICEVIRIEIVGKLKD